MDTPETVGDVASVSLWNDAYDAASLDEHDNLWGDPPVPAAISAAQMFAAAGACAVLDLPCGDGRNLPPLSAGAPVLLGGDTSLNAMAIAEKVASKAGIRAATVFLRMDVFDTGLLADSVDGIFCWDLLGHLEDPQSALREMYRITRPGGAIVANMWTMNDCQTSDPDIRETGPKEYIDHFNFYCKFYDQADLAALLESVRMTAESIEVSAWHEPAHAEYRTYEHDHESLVAVIRKPGR